jgi:hypothetical protein
MRSNLLPRRRTESPSRKLADGGFVGSRSTKSYRSDLLVPSCVVLYDRSRFIPGPVPPLIKYDYAHPLLLSMTIFSIIQADNHCSLLNTAGTYSFQS